LRRHLRHDLAKQGLARRSKQRVLGLELIEHGPSGKSGGGGNRVDADRVGRARAKQCVERPQDPPSCFAMAGPHRGCFDAGHRIGRAKVHAGRARRRRTVPRELRIGQPRTRNRRPFRTGRRHAKNLPGEEAVRPPRRDARRASPGRGAPLSGPGHGAGGSARFQARRRLCECAEPAPRRAFEPCPFRAPPEDHEAARQGRAVRAAGAGDHSRGGRPGSRSRATIASRRARGLLRLER
ncbi:MAG: hypothetical protein JWP15_3266, partial [Alphaproteobacteria bacterium]|nr:hypothetical protein [Alphaproteobacteria bacterium]